MATKKPLANYSGKIKEITTSDTIPASALPNPSSSTLGGVQSIAAVASKWINTISTAGVPTATQPSTSDISGIGTAASLVGVQGPEAEYGGTITWTATGNPTTPTGLRQFYTRFGNQVTWQIMLAYTTPGIAVTNVVLTFPTEFPTPATPTGFSGASAKIWPVVARANTSIIGTVTNIGTLFIARNAGNTAFEISGPSFTSGANAAFYFCGSYFTS